MGAGPDMGAGSYSAPEDDVIDAEWFLENEITWYAEALVTVEYYVWGYHVTNGFISESRYFEYSPTDVKEKIFRSLKEFNICRIFRTN